MIKQCKWCGKEYETDLYWIVFCSDECLNAYKEQKEQVLKPCEICGELFHPTRSTQKFCSRECYQENARRRSKKWSQEHREEKAAYIKAWEKANPDKVKANKKRFRERHKEEIRESNRKFNKERKEYFRNYYQNHKEKWTLSKNNKKIKECSEKHENCFNCPTPNGECLFD